MDMANGPIKQHKVNVMGFKMSQSLIGQRKFLVVDFITDMPAS